MRDHGHPAHLLSAFLDDELNDAVASRVTRHLADCPRCLGELEALRRARAALRELPRVSAPDALLAAVPAAATRDQGSRRGRRAVAGFVVSVVGVLVVAFAVGAPEGGDVVPPVDAVVVDHVARTGGGPMIQPVDLDR